MRLGKSLFFLLFLTAIVYLCVLVLAVHAQDGQNGEPVGTVGGAVALSTAVNQAVEWGKRRFSTNKNTSEGIPSEEYSLQAIRAKLKLVEKPATNAYRKARGIEVYLIRHTKNFSPKETDHS